MKLFTSFASIFASVSLIAACGNGSVDIVATHQQPTAQECPPTLSLVDCQVVGPNATPPPVAASPAATLRITGDEPTPPVSSWTNQGFAQVPFAVSPAWETLGINNQAPISKNFTVNSMTVAGNCTQVNLKVKVTNPAPQCFQGMNSLQSHAGNFKVCNDGNDVLVKFEDGADTLFNDYQFRIHEVNNRPLAYKMIGANLFVCLQ